MFCSNSRIERLNVMIDGRKVFDEPVKNDMTHTKTFKR